MTIFELLLNIKKQKPVRKTIKDYQHEVLLRQTREQFEKLLKLGKIPVALL